MEGGVIESGDTMNSRSEDDVDQGCCHPKRLCFRFIGLVFISVLGFGSYFCYDNPAALQDKFEHDLGMSTSQFVLLYSLYSWPNVILCFIGGYLLDTIFGIRLGTVIYIFIGLVGQAIFSFGAYVNIFWMMALGRFIFGIGCESLAVAQNSYAVLWFKGKELNMVFGLQMSISRLGSTVNFLVLENIYDYVNQFYQKYTCVGIVLALATLTCVGSLLCSIILMFMDKHAEKVLKRGHGEEKKVMKFTDIKNFESVFWLTAAICVAYYIAIFPFIALGKVFFEWKYNYSPYEANRVNSLVYLISAIASPFLGYIVDKTGKNVSWVIASIVGTLVAHALLNFSQVNPYTCMILMGFSYAMLASSLWPLIALVIEEHQLGTAYGIAQALQNTGLAVISIVTGIIVDKHGYFWLEMFFLGWVWVSLITAIIIWIVDRARYDGYLDMTPGQRHKFGNFMALPTNSETESLLPSADAVDFGSSDLLPQYDISVVNIHIRNRYLSRIGAPAPVQTIRSMR